MSRIPDGLLFFLMIPFAILNFALIFVIFGEIKKSISNTRSRILAMSPPERKKFYVTRVLALVWTAIIFVLVGKFYDWILNK